MRSKHRRHQVALSLAIVVTSVAVIVIPAYANQVSLATMLVNLAWLWDG
jgi:hypothetical protein